MNWLLNREKREEGCRLKRLYLFHRLNTVFAIASGICFQRAIQFLISACVVGLSFITASQWSIVTLHDTEWFFSVFSVFLYIPCLHSLHLIFIYSKCLEFSLHSSHIFQEPLRILLFKKNFS